MRTYLVRLRLKPNGQAAYRVRATTPEEADAEARVICKREFGSPGETLEIRPAVEVSR